MSTEVFWHPAGLARVPPSLVHRHTAGGSIACPVHVGISKMLRALTQHARLEPQPFEVADGARSSVVGVGGSTVHDVIVVDELHDAWLECHRHVVLGVVGQFDDSRVPSDDLR